MTTSPERVPGVPALAFEGVGYSAGGEEILRDVSLELRPGSFTVLTGPSGSGKTTLLRLAADLDTPTAGTVTLDGRDMARLDGVAVRRRVVYVFQTPHLFGRTVAEDLAFPATARGEHLDRGRARRALAALGLSADVADHEPGSLSGGERQRVSLARSLLANPQVLLLDEPTSALDADNTARVERLVARVHAAGATVAWVSHDRDQCARLGRVLITMRAGRIVGREER